MSASGPKQPLINWAAVNRRWHANLGMFSAITLGLIALSCFTIAHKVDGGVAHVLKEVHTGKFLPEAYRWIWIDSQGLLLGWLIFSGWLIHHKSRKRGQGKVSVDAPGSLLVLYQGSSPQAHRLAHDLSKRLTAAKGSAALVRTEDHARIDWSKLTAVALILDQPSEADPFCALIRSPKAPKLRGTRLSTLRLRPQPDSPPLLERWTALGAVPLAPSLDAPSEEDPSVAAWLRSVVAAVQPPGLADSRKAFSKTENTAVS